MYLTTLDPGMGREIVKENNWDGLAGIMDAKMDAYFEFLMPSSEVSRVKDKRDIQIFPGSLQLADYKWSLRNWDGELLATQHFMVSSQGRAVKVHSYVMGRYTLVKNMVMFGGIPVYKQDVGDAYLYRDEGGSWCVGDVAGDTMCYLRQPTEMEVFPSPHKTNAWIFKIENGELWDEDVTLRVYPCY